MVLDFNAFDNVSNQQGVKVHPALRHAEDRDTAGRGHCACQGAAALASGVAGREARAAASAGGGAGRLANSIDKDAWHWGQQMITMRLIGAAFSSFDPKNEGCNNVLMRVLCW